MCFVSSADRVGRAGHGQLIGTPLTLALLDAQGAGDLAVPVHRPFTLGTHRLELIPSGRGLGAAALHVDLGERSVLYAGELGPAMEVRTADAVIVAAPLDRALPTVASATAQLVTWTRDQLAAERAPVLVVDGVLDGFEIVACLAKADVAVSASRSLRCAAARVPGMPALRTPGREPTAQVRIETDRPAPAKRAAIALVSLRALAGHRGFDAGFAWPFVADRDRLLGWIEQTRARAVYVTGACAEAIAARLGPRARVLGPPHQMTLFPREATR